MFISSREKNIIQILIEQKSGVTIDYLSERLNVSNRTIYREMSSLESSLAHFQIKLLREAEGYRLVGTKGMMEELKQQIYQSPEELTVQQRQSLLVIMLLREEQEIKMEALAYDLNVSVSTIQSDLQSIAEIFEAYQIEIVRKKAKGIKAIALETNRRLIISGLITSEINEYDFFQLFTKEGKIKKERFERSTNPFLRLLSAEDLERAYQVVRDFSNRYFEEVTDTQYQRLVILLSLSINRMRKGQYISNLMMDDEVRVGLREENLKIGKEVLMNLQITDSIEDFLSAEVFFFAIQIQGLSVHLQNEFADDYDMTLDYEVRQLIRLVSNDMGWNFYHDETLFRDLLVHLSAALNRAKAPMPESSNFLLDKIYDEYPELSFVVKQRLKEIFPKTHFLSNEVIYIVIHFASAYERNPYKEKLSVLVICSSGVGTAKILESRLRKYIPEITDVQISRISQLPQVKFDRYDLILSTVFLQGFKTEYKVVTPLLMEDEVKSIKLYVRQISSKRKNKKQPRKVEELFDQTEEDFKDFYEKISEANIVLDYFDIVKITDETELTAILKKICQQLEGTILTNPEQVEKKLEKRMQLAPIGLPETNMALFHSVDESVVKPYFAIYELDQPISIEAIDHKLIQMERILMMLGPDPLSETTQEILGGISSAIVENPVNTKLFNNGTKELIHGFLSQLFLERIKN
ncbi:BglG family transcription antiterminator [Pisciglobus halotolerans]|uniref:Transcriptional antiterminator, BglG family n=1 Tax=Pisciglobus halotolerans TaxID=745365 RepID=A0A1I3AW52_9LACT|nr:BglG family transcription antiterminator [Pisciglobus halotolerans]SFH54338.1 transcriptional antiterminator, BglG family [Pisciglobus halotolerans]